MAYSGELPIVEFGFPGPLRDQLVAAILDGTKISTTSTVYEYTVESAALPQPGQRQVVIDSDGTPVAVIEITEVTRTRLADVDVQHALDEGEGFRTVVQWRRAHEEYWHSDRMRSYVGDPTYTVTEDTELVLERFRVVEVFQ